MKKYNIYKKKNKCKPNFKKKKKFFLWKCHHIRLNIIVIKILLNPVNIKINNKVYQININKFISIKNNN